MRNINVVCGDICSAQYRALLTNDNLGYDMQLLIVNLGLPDKKVTPVQLSWSFFVFWLPHRFIVAANLWPLSCIPAIFRCIRGSATIRYIIFTLSLLLAVLTQWQLKTNDRRTAKSSVSVRFSTCISDNSWSTEETRKLTISLQRTHSTVL